MDLLPTLEQVLPKTGIQRVIVTNVFDLIEAQPAPQSALPGLITLPAALALGAASDLPDPSTGINDIAMLQYTGDIAVMQVDGFIKICDRVKDMILVSGFNVYPNEIEGVVHTHPDIIECAAVGVADEKSGEAVKLYAVTSNPQLDQESLRGFCREQLTAYKVPRYVEFCDDLPKSNVGKILRRELRD